MIRIATFSDHSWLATESIDRATARANQFLELIEKQQPSTEINEIKTALTCDGTQAAFCFAITIVMDLPLGADKHLAQIVAQAQNLDMPNDPNDPNYIPF